MWKCTVWCQFLILFLGWCNEVGAERNEKGIQESQYWWNWGIDLIVVNIHNLHNQVIIFSQIFQHKEDDWKIKIMQ